MNTLTTITLVIMFLMTICVIAWLIWENGKINAKNAADYEKFYSQVYVIIDINKVCESNYNYIKKLLIRLGKMKHKNREKTSVLSTNFFWKYRAIAAQRASKDN